MMRLYLKKRILTEKVEVEGNHLKGNDTIIWSKKWRQPEQKKVVKQRAGGVQ